MRFRRFLQNPMRFGATKTAFWKKRTNRTSGQPYSKAEWRRKPMWPARFWFGGFDFKGQAQSHDIKRAAELAMRHIDVITTSGVATGHAPDVEKIKRIRAHYSATIHLQAQAELTIDNVSDLMAAGVDAFLVSTGISKPASDEFRSGQDDDAWRIDPNERLSARTTKENDDATSGRVFSLLFQSKPVADQVPVDDCKNDYQHRQDAGACPDRNVSKAKENRSENRLLGRRVDSHT